MPSVAHRVCILLVAFLSGCSGCGGPPSELVVEGRYGFLRCASLELDRDEPWEELGFSLQVQERLLSLQTDKNNLQVVVLAGPGPGPATLESLTEHLNERPADLVVLLGGLGDSESIASSTLAALSALPSLSILMGGGRDDGEVWMEALDTLGSDSLERVIDARGLRGLRFGESVLALWSGGPEGRYARTRLSCGFHADELAAFQEALSDYQAAGFISWTAPAGVGFGLGGVDVGSQAVQGTWQELGAPTGVFAWPRVLEPTPVEGEAQRAHFVQRLDGIPMLREDGTPARGRVLRFVWEAGHLRLVRDAP